MTQLTLDGKPMVPPADTYRVKVLRHEHMKSARGLMRRLVAEITHGLFAGELVYKPLTMDVIGLGWLERTTQGLGIPMPKVSLGQMIDALLDAMVGSEGVATTYHFAHKEGVFLTIRNLKRA